MPLTGLGAPLVSFPFVEVDHALPSQGLMRQFVLVLVARFRMSVAEIVMAYTLVSPNTIEPHHHSQPTPRSRCPSPQHQPPRNNQVEQMLWLNPSLLRCYSVRPIFLGCCVLVLKMSREGAAPSSNLLSRVQDVFNLLDVTLLSRIEQQLLEVLSSQSAPIAPQPRPRISLPHSQCVSHCGGSALPHSSLPLCANVVQVMDWRMPTDAGQYEVYADALFGAAADALLAPPMPDEN